MLVDIALEIVSVSAATGATSATLVVLTSLGPAATTLAFASFLVVALRLLAIDILVIVGISPPSFIILILFAGLRLIFLVDSVITIVDHFDTLFFGLVDFDAVSSRPLLCLSLVEVLLLL